jgi:hypothetical protein
MRVGQGPSKPGHILGGMQRVLLDKSMTHALPVSADVPPLEIYKALVECMSWDEESGRLCLLLGSTMARTIDEACPKEIIVVDFV